VAVVERIDWRSGTWTTPPVEVRVDGDHLLVTAAEGSDAWRHTSYGFVHDDAHGLLAPLPVGSAVEVDVDLDLTEQFDQAGVLLRADAQTWVKAGVEMSDGQPQLGAVVTLSLSDWSTGQVPDWAGRTATVRLSRGPDAVTVRARVEGEDWRLVRVAPFPGDMPASAGPYCCAPTRAGLTVRFRAWRTGAADTSLH
jgi:regulation of enolase protein 1 (concanavalin A-like superfamily)